VAPSSLFDFVTTSKEHNDGGANCFITNDINHFTSYLQNPIYVKQLNGSTVQALGYGLKLVQCPTTKVIIPLWPTYFMPNNPQCTFSPTALRHYLQYTITTEHLASLSIVTSTGIKLKLPSINIDSKHHLLDYHLFNIVKHNWL